MIKIIEENNYYFIGNRVDYGLNEDGPCGIETDYRLGEILGIDINIIESKFENDFNATWDNPHNHTWFGFHKLLIGFKNRDDAEKALEWVESLKLLNKLG